MSESCVASAEARTCTNVCTSKSRLLQIGSNPWPAISLALCTTHMMAVSQGSNPVQPANATLEGPSGGTDSQKAAAAAVPARRLLLEDGFGQLEQAEPGPVHIHMSQGEEGSQRVLRQQKHSLTSLRELCTPNCMCSSGALGPTFLLMPQILQKTFSIIQTYAAQTRTVEMDCILSAPLESNGCVA
eukprot:1137563-Pelagomonas_calceolata.AAC.2